MRASIAHVLGTAALVALPALVSAQAPRRPPRRPPRHHRRSRSAIPLPTSIWPGSPRSATRRISKYEPKRIKLSDFKGKQNVVVAFFPAAFSPGCTNEMKQQSSHGTFTSANTRVLGVSVDSTWSNRAFREQLESSSRS